MPLLWNRSTEKTNKKEGAVTLNERIETAFDEAIRHRRAMLEARYEVSNKEANAKLEYRDDWAGAKNNDVRRVLLEEWLAGDDVYWQARLAYDKARDEYRVALLEIERLKLLVALGGGMS